MAVLRRSAQSLARIDASFPDEAKLSIVLAEQLYHTSRIGASESERRSWDRSVPVLAQDLVDAGLGGVEMLIEHQLPLTSKRADAILAGVGHDGADRYVIVELKQWSEAEMYEDDPELVLVAGVRGGPRLHPARQVSGYRDYLVDFTEGLNPESIQAVAYLHNASDGDVFDLCDGVEGTSIRLFTKSQRGKFLQYLNSQFSPQSGAAAADRLESARIRPSKQLLQLAAPVLKSRDQFVLLDEQRLAFDLVMHAVERSGRSDFKEVVIVTGGPGSGKSVIAISLLAELAERDRKVLHATGSRSFTETMRRHVARGSSRLKALFKYFNSFMKAHPNDLDVLICDEAHRIRETSANRYTRAADRTGRPQVEELLAAARVPVFLLDENQVVRHGERGTVEDIRGHALSRGFDVHEINLDAQYRCGGSRAYEEWVLRLLGLEPGGPLDWIGDPHFDVSAAGTPWDLESRLKSRLDEGYSARIAAGFCWKWSKKPNADGTLVPDVVIADWARPWNNPDDRSVGEAPPAVLWASRDGGFGQVGCVYTAQGFEYDYSGVIVGPDLLFRDGKLVTDRTASRDPALNGSVPDFEADRLIRNTYKVLLTRGLRGTLLYSTDPETQDFLSKLLST